jgi:hypothetical protein
MKQRFAPAARQHASIEEPGRAPWLGVNDGRRWRVYVFYVLPDAEERDLWAAMPCLRHPLPVANVMRGANERYCFHASAWKACHRRSRFSFPALASSISTAVRSVLLRRAATTFVL